MKTNYKFLISRNKREGWYYGKSKIPPDFSLWLAGKNGQVRVEKCFSLRSKWDGKREWEQSCQ